MAQTRSRIARQDLISELRPEERTAYNAAMDKGFLGDRSKKRPVLRECWGIYCWEFRLPRVVVSVGEEYSRVTLHLDDYLRLSQEGIDAIKALKLTEEKKKKWKGNSGNRVSIRCPNDRAEEVASKLVAIANKHRVYDSAQAGEW